MFQWLGTEFPEQGMAVRVNSGPGDNSKTTGIVKTELATIIEIPGDMIMGPLIIAFLGDPQTAGHSEMNQQHSRSGFKEQVLGTSIGLAKSGPAQFLVEISRNRKPQFRITDHHFFDDGPSNLVLDP